MQAKVEHTKAKQAKVEHTKAKVEHPCWGEARTGAERSRQNTSMKIKSPARPDFSADAQTASSRGRNGLVCACMTTVAGCPSDARDVRAWWSTYEQGRPALLEAATLWMCR